MKTIGMTGKKHSVETKLRMRIAQIGKRLSEATKLKMSISRLGKEPWNKGAIGAKCTKETRIKMSESHKGLNTWTKGKKPSIETRSKMSFSQKKRVSENRHPHYKGGVTSINEKIRKSFEYKLWREAVFKRDNYLCIWGGKKHGSKLHADHIKPFAYYPELRFAIDNGRTLCETCHRTTDTFGRQKFLNSTI